MLNFSSKRHLRDNLFLFKSVRLFIQTTTVVIVSLLVDIRHLNVFILHHQRFLSACFVFRC